MASSRKPVGPLPRALPRRRGGAGGLLLSCPTSRQKRPALCRGRIYPTTLETGKDLRDGHEIKRASTGGERPGSADRGALAVATRRRAHRTDPREGGDRRG